MPQVQVNQLVISVGQTKLGTDIESTLIFRPWIELDRHFNRLNLDQKLVELILRLIEFSLLSLLYQVS